MNSKIRYFTLFGLSILFTICIIGQTPNGRRVSSLDGLYAVTVPPAAEAGGGGPLEEEFTKGLGDGYSSYWNGPGVYLQAGHVDFNEERTTPAPSERRKLFLEALSRLKLSQTGAAGLRERQLKMKKLDVTELVFKGAGKTAVYRLFATTKSIVRFTAIFSPDEAETVAMKFLNSIEAPTRPEIIAEKIAEATPEALPQCGANFGMVTDLFELGDKGKVQSIVVEREEVEDGQTERSFMQHLMLNRGGRMTKEIAYEFNAPDFVRVFGCIDGRRVSKSGYASYENRFSAMGPPNPNAKPPDNRYTNVYEVILDPDGRVGQKLTYGNNAILYTTAKFTYGDRTIEIVKTDEDGKVKETIIQTLDAKNRPISMVNRSFGSDGNEWRDTYKYVLFDQNGNWIKRTGIYERFEHGNKDDTSSFTEFRSIKYYK